MLRSRPPLGVAFLFLLAAGVCLGELRAGASKKAITPDLKAGAPVFLAGFGQNRVATAVHDDLFVRCLALSAGGKPVALCGVDSVGLFLDDVQKIRERVGSAADVVVAALHDHEAPDTMGLWGPALGVSGINEQYNQLVVERVAEAIAEAVRSLRPARVKLARVQTPELDGFIYDNRPPVVHDSELVVLSASDKAGKPIATLVNWANHPETLGSKNTEITADYPAYFHRRLEERVGGVAVLLNGAVGGMQSPLGAEVRDPVTGEPAQKDSFRKAEIIGCRVADLAAEAVGKSKPVRIGAIAFREKGIRIPVSNQGFRQAAKANLYRGRKPMNPDGTINTVVGILRLGKPSKPVLEAAMTPGELYPELSVGGVARYPGADFPEAEIEPALKSMLKAPYRMVIGMANDEIGYIIPKAEWDEKEPWLQNAARRWYGEVNSVGPEAAPRIAEAMRELLGGKR